MPGGTGHAAGAGPQAKESGSDFRRRNPEAMFPWTAVTPALRLRTGFPPGSGSPCSGSRMGTSSGDRDSSQAAMALTAEVHCFCVCVRV